MAKLNGKEIFPNLRHLKISNNNERNGINKSEVPNSLIDLLYTLSLIDLSDTVEKDFTSESLTGTIIVQASYKEYIDSLTKIPGEDHYYFPDLKIENSYLYILFKDSKVEQKIVDNLNLFIPNYQGQYDGVISNLTFNTSNSNYYGFRKIFSSENYKFYNSANQTTENLNKLVDIEYFNELPQFEGLTMLGVNEFRNCIYLKQVDLSKIEYISSGAFLGCESLQYFNGESSERYTLSLPKLRADGLKYDAFYTSYSSDNTSDKLYHGPQIKRIESLGACTVIGGNCFYQNQYLESVNDSVFEKLSELGGGAFHNCSKLVIEDLNLPNCLKVGNNAFQNTKLEKISSIGPSATLAYNAFCDCKYLTEVSQDFFNNILSIGDNVFNGCEGLVIPDLSLPLLTSIGGSAFKNTQVRKVSNLGQISELKGFNDCKLLNDVTVPSTCTVLGDSAFSGCTGLTTPAVNKIIRNITTFKNNCLSGCTSLNGVLKLNSSVIGYNVFKNTNLKCLYLPNIKNTNGVNGTSIPTTARSDNFYSFSTANGINICYFRYIEKINGYTFGGYLPRNGTYNTTYDGVDDATGLPYFFTIGTTTNNLSYKRNNITFTGNLTIDDDGSNGHTSASTFEYTDKETGVTKTVIVNTLHNGNVYEYKGEPLCQTDHCDPYTNSTTFSKVKYLVINWPTPPQYWQVYGTSWSSAYRGSLSLYQNKQSNGTITEETFQYLCVPREAIPTYKTWDALNPSLINFQSKISADHYRELKNATNFDVNTRIIAIQSMGHFKTYAEWLLSDDVPNPNDPAHTKYDYLIEEYMNMTKVTLVTIDPNTNQRIINETPFTDEDWAEFWDPTPTWSA